MFSAAGRFIMVVFAFLCAVAATLAIAVQLGLERATHALHGDDDAVFTALDWLRTGLSLSFASTLILALLVIIAGEVARIRQALFYIAGGGLAVAAAPLLIELQRTGTATAHLPAFIWQVFATAGFVGGGVYWLIAGRNA